MESVGDGYPGAAMELLTTIGSVLTGVLTLAIGVFSLATMGADDGD